MAKLTAEIIEQIAFYYDLKPTERIVVENAEQANYYHGTKAPALNWGTDSQGYYDAEKLLRGYLDEETRVMQCDALADRDFCHNAYGED